KRTQDFLKELAARDDGRTYLIGIHGCAVRAMLNQIYEDPSDFWQGHVPYNCAVNILEAEGGVIRFAERDKLYYDPGLAMDHYKQ
ncbi:MAG: histidine phosphatase family protein, partial [Lachnospiraceae bacterium]|nr:histidine phosphatase family protein [Lachnospiraceae bacterium]